MFEIGGDSGIDGARTGAWKGGLPVRDVDPSDEDDLCGKCGVLRVHLYCTLHNITKRRLTRNSQGERDMAEFCALDGWELEEEAGANVDGRTFKMVSGGA